MGFYDAKGYWRSDGDGFYDSRGNWVSPGGAFYDGNGYLRSPGDGFYDSRGYWVSPGGAFYDGKGYLQSAGAAVGAVVNNGTGIVVAAGYLLSIPVVALWLMAVFLVDWIAAHLYLVFAGYAIVALILCIAITKCKKHRGISAVFSFIGNYLCVLSFAYLTLRYAVPYVIIRDGSFGSFVEFMAALAVGAGGVTILQFFNYYHEKAALEFMLGTLFFTVVIIYLKYGAGDCSTIESLAEIYNIKATALFMVLFGFTV